MKLFAVGSLLLVGALAGAAHADVVRTYKWSGEGPPGTKPTTSSALLSHTLFLNNCKTANCTLHPGSESAQNNSSTIANHTVTLPPFPYSDTTWNQVVACVKATYAPFDIQIVTTEPPSNTSYFEEMVADTCSDVDTTCQQGVVGIAPFNCDIYNNSITFAFAGDPYYSSDTVNRLCWTIAQESAHAFGLDHEYLSSDPMTYLTGPEPKRFQNTTAHCGTLSQMNCLCGGTTQNSVQMLTQILGSATPTPPMVVINDPANNATEPPGFPVHATLTDDQGIAKSELYVDNMLVQTITFPPYAYNTPATLADGSHTIKVTAYDLQNTPGSASITVTVKAGAPPGDLGHPCTNNAECSTGACGSDGVNMYCTQACNPASSNCPSGFTCAPAGSGGECWPASGDGGGGASAGCSTTGDGGSALPVVIGLGFVAFGLRRRRR